MDKIYDSIIIGGSAAGVTSAIYLKRQNLNFLLITKDIGGNINFTDLIENYTGFPSIKGFELVQKFKEHLEKYQIEPLIDLVTNISKENGIFKVKTISAKEYFSKTVIVASGSVPKKLNVPGEEKYKNKGVSYCAICDAPLFKDKVVAIIGGGNSALSAGNMASDICKKVYMIHKGDKFKGEKILLEKLEKKENVEIIYNALTQEFIGEEFVKKLRFLDLKTNEIKEIDVDGIFIYIGLQPQSDFIPDDWQIKNEKGEIIIDEFCQTKIPGLFAAGDVTNNPFKQIGVAVGQGIISALKVIEYLSKNN